MKKLSDTKDELEKSVSYKKNVYLHRRETAQR